MFQCCYLHQRLMVSRTKATHLITQAPCPINQVNRTIRFPHSMQDLHFLPWAEEVLVVQVVQVVDTMLSPRPVDVVLPPLGQI